MNSNNDEALSQTITSSNTKKEEKKVLFFLTILFLGTISFLFSVLFTIPFLVSIFSFLNYKKSGKINIIRTAYTTNKIIFLIDLILIAIYFIYLLLYIASNGLERIVTIVIWISFVIGVFSLIKLNKTFFLTPLSQHPNLFLKKNPKNTTRSLGIDDLTKLAQLKESGIISDEEFTQAKKRILEID